MGCFFLSSISMLNLPPPPPPCKVFSSHQGPLGLHRKSMGKGRRRWALPPTRFPLSWIGRGPGAEVFLGPMLWWLPRPLPTAGCFRKAWVWMPTWQMWTLPSTSCGALAKFPRFLILSVLICTLEIFIVDTYLALLHLTLLSSPIVAFFIN